MKALIQETPTTIGRWERLWVSSVIINTGTAKPLYQLLGEGRRLTIVLHSNHHPTEHTVYDVKEEEVEKVSYTLIHSQSPIPGSIGSTPGLKDNDWRDEAKRTNQIPGERMIPRSSPYGDRGGEDGLNVCHWQFLLLTRLLLLMISSHLRILGGRRARQSQHLIHTIQYNNRTEGILDKVQMNTCL